MLKHRLRSLGLTLTAALSLLAFFAITAQAEEKLKDGGTAGTFTSSLGFPHEPILGEIEALTGTALVHGVLLVPGRNIEILCTGFDVLEGRLNSSTEGLAKLEYLGCLTFDHTTKAAITTCVIDNLNNAVNDDKTIEAKVKLLPRLHKDLAGNQRLYVLAEAHGNDLALILYLKNTGCTLPHENQVTGAVIFEALQLAANEWLLEANEAIQKLFLVNLGGTPPVIHGDRCLFGAFDCYVIGNAKVRSEVGNFGIV